MDPVATPEGPEGAGERSAEAAEKEVNNAEYAVCFERFGMGDLEMVDLEEQQTHPNVVQGAQNVEQQKKETCDYCCLAYYPLDDSDEGNGPASGFPIPEGPGLDSNSAHVSDVMSRLKFCNVDWTSVAPAQVVAPATTASASTSSQGLAAECSDCSAIQGQEDDDEDDSDADDNDDDSGDGDGDLGERAPTPDNTPEHTPSREFQKGQLQLSALDALSSERDRQLFESLEVETSSKAEPAVAAVESNNVLSRAWSRLMGRVSREHHQEDSHAKEEQQGDEEDEEEEEEEQDEEDDEDLCDHDNDREAQTIEELEATLEEVRLDGDGDDPVVSYLVEEAEDPARAPLSGSPARREVEVEEVQDDDNAQVPSQKSSGLLARIFARSRTNHDVSHPTSKRGKPESRDRLLHRILHSVDKKKGPKRADKPQPHAALRHTLPRMLSRWLGQNESSLWGAEGDAGETGVSQDLTEVGLPNQSTGKKMAEFASQTDDSMWDNPPLSMRRQKDSRGIGGMLGIGPGPRRPRRTALAPKPTDTRETC